MGGVLIVQLAPISAVGVPTQADEVYDVVQPSQLFAIARSRFDASAASLGIGGSDAAPTALHALIAIQQAEGGIKALQSALVPTTTFALRARAVAAMEQGRQAITLLRDYHQAVYPLGSGRLQRETVPEATLDLLGVAQLRLASASAATGHGA